VAIKHRIGYLPEESYLYRYLTAAETLDFFGALFGLPAEERRRRSDQLLEMVGLANSKDRSVGEFSKGMARRIGIAQALVNDPDLVILDEPTSGLDPIGCREVKDLIRLLTSRGKTVVLCSHLLADVEDVCDEVVVLYGGKIRSQGGLRDLLTVQEKTRIIAPRLAPALVQDLMKLLRQGTGEEAKIDHPTMSLEDFFLDVVRKAKEASLETAGAQAGGQIAAYLRGAQPQDGSSARILQALRDGAESASQVVSTEDKPESQAQTAPVQPAVDAAKLAQLGGQTGVPSPEQPGAATQPGTPADTAAGSGEANKRIEELLRGKSTER
jgi:ABC-2 type transport system ATP-binding protein